MMMFKEIKAEEALKRAAEGEEVVAIWESRIMPIEEALEGLRFLVDEPETPKTAPAAEEKKPERKKQTLKPAKLEEEILKAWNRGARNIKEIMEITGASYNTVRKYIPENEKG